MDALRVALGDRAHDAALALDVRRLELAQQAEVHDAQAAVGAQQAVVGMRVSRDHAVAPGQAEIEAQDQLAHAVAFGLGKALDLLRAEPVDVLGDEDSARRQVGVHPRHPHVRMAAEAALEAALVLCLDLVVELVGDPLAHLGQHAHRRRRRARGAS